MSSQPKRVLIVVANPGVSTTLGWPVGFWAAELTHPYYELTERGVEVTIASPDGGKVEFDAYSDPRDPSNWSSEDLITMGFINTPACMALLEGTARLADLDLDALRRADDRRRPVADVQLPRRRGGQGRDRALLRGREAHRRLLPRDRGARRRQARPTAPTSSRARPSPASPTWRRTTATRSSAGRSCPGASRTPCASAAPTTSTAACSRRSPCATGGSSPASSSTRAVRSPQMVIETLGV